MADVRAAGEGVIDGQASNEFWWPWKGLAVGGWKEGQPKQDEQDKGDQQNTGGWTWRDDWTDAWRSSPARVEASGGSTPASWPPRAHRCW